MPLLLTLLLGCPETKYGDSTPTTSTWPYDDSGTTTTPTGDCNTDNEECAPRVCEAEESPDMLPGSDCMACHSRGGDDEADPWSVGGTLYTDIWGAAGAGGATVRVTDSTGTTLTLRTRGSGNFYSEDRLVPPLTAEVETDAGILRMSAEIETGACNSCHRCGGEAGGKLYAP